MRESDHQRSPEESSVVWSVVALVTAAALFWAATSNAVYEVTSPAALSWHVLLRKAYSIAAFALVAFTAQRALGFSTRAVLRGAVLIGAYSGAIEIAQALRGSHEGPLWNAFDVACGAAGGVVGVLVEARIRRSRRRT